MSNNVSFLSTFLSKVVYAVRMIPFPCFLSIRGAGHHLCPPSPPGPCSTLPSCLCTCVRTWNSVTRIFKTKQVSHINLRSVTGLYPNARRYCQLLSPVPSITPIEFFYTDPSVSYGRRIPNIVSELRVSASFKKSIKYSLNFMHILPVRSIDPQNSSYYTSIPGQT